MVYHQGIPMSLHNEIARELKAQRFDINDDGIYFPRLSALASGEYFGRVNGGQWEKEGNNLIVTEGFAHILNVAFGNTAKPSGYYLAIFSASTTPASNWTAASFAAAASEIVSMTEGHTGATRPAWTPTNTSTGSIDNMTTVATLTMATAAQLNVTGAALLTSSQRGGTSGALVSASLYSAPRVFQNGDIYDLGYRLNLTT